MASETGGDQSNDQCMLCCYVLEVYVCMQIKNKTDKWLLNSYKLYPNISLLKYNYRIGSYGLVKWMQFQLSIHFFVLICGFSKLLSGPFESLEYTYLTFILKEIFCWF